MVSVDEKKIRDEYHHLTKLLIEKKLTITTMESITSGQIASLITDIEGASAVLKGAFITYCNEAKVMQGVPKEVIETFGVYSAETARAMAKAAKDAYKADISIGITGSTGNVDPANNDSVPGEVYYAIDFNGKMIDGYFKMGQMENRLSYKLYAAGEVVQKLLSLLS